MSTLKRSPLAPEDMPAMPQIPGVRLATAESGIRYSGRTDVLLAELVEGTQAAGVFTRSLTAAAPIEWCKSINNRGKACLLIVNSGNANAFTGKAGQEAVEETLDKASDVYGCAREDIWLASTGVIGEPLPYKCLTAVMEPLKAKLDAAAWDAAAKAICTTDTFPKMATRHAKIGEAVVTLNGIAKGSGMIAPDMATMLGFIFTDAAIPSELLHAMLQDANRKSFNAITVDGDTSTNDMVALFATGKAQHPPVTKTDDPLLADFKKALRELCQELAHLIVKDGEGATKFITIKVTGAESESAAHRIAMSIANSPLVKTAIAGEDANWGRIVMAVGKAGEKADRDKLIIHIGEQKVAENGQVSSGYSEAKAAEYMKGQAIDIAVDVGVGTSEATVWTCDLTHAYIDINADYRS